MVRWLGPAGINPQGVARSADGRPLASGRNFHPNRHPGRVGLNAVEYEEIHGETNPFGLFYFVIGQGARQRPVPICELDIGEKMAAGRDG